jgi:hypothetical protein
MDIQNSPLESLYQILISEVMAADLSVKAATAKTNLQQIIDQFYADKHYDDAKDILGGENYDFIQQSEFTLTNLKSVIDEISKAVFAGVAAPTGTTIDSDGVEAATKALGSEVKEVADLELYIAGKTFDFLSAIILGFGTTTSISSSIATKSESLGYGLQLFVLVAADSFRPPSFPDNCEIYKYFYLYEVKFSLKQALAEISQTLIELYQKQIATFRDKVNQLHSQQSTLNPTAYQSMSEIYQTLIENAETKLKELQSAQ